jgi:cystathionine gamma-synthase
MRFTTLTVHAGVDKDSAYNSVTTPVYQTSTFRFIEPGKTAGYDYTRTANPTRAALEENIAALEGGIAGVATATGMAAVTVALHFLKSGDHMLCTHDCYGGTERILRTYQEQFNIDVDWIDMSDVTAVRNALRPNTRAIWIETPSNPLLRVLDIASLTAIAHAHGALAVVDNTFLSPFFQRPFEFGVDIVLHSTTKYLNGHSDVVGGAVVVNSPQHAERLRFLCNALGQGASPFDCWLVLRGIKTLVPRMRLHEHNALAVASYLATHSRVRRVYYPGLPSHPGHALAKRQQHGFGGMVSFEVEGNKKEVDAVLRGLRVFTLAESLGGVESLVEHPVTMSHGSMQPERREAAGITEQVIRLSVGIEDEADLLEDLEQALAFK